MLCALNSKVSKPTCRPKWPTTERTGEGGGRWVVARGGSLQFVLHVQTADTDGQMYISCSSQGENQCTARMHVC